MSSTILKAYHDKEFLDCREARPLRILSEYLGPEKKFKENGVKHTVVFFGSARIKPDSSDPMSKYYHAADDLSYRLASWSESRPSPEEKIFICTGGGPGIMEAANKGASRAGGQTIGLNISLPFEQNPNPYISKDLNFEFHYFYMRKMWFLYQAKAIVVFPGGYGTFDELFETLTLIQTKKIKKHYMLVYLYDREYWEKLINFKMLADLNLISREDLDIFKFFDTPEEGFNMMIPDIIKSTDDVEKML